MVRRLGQSRINDKIDEVWTLTDLRRLRDDLTALLNDERLLGALRETGAA